MKEIDHHCLASSFADPRDVAAFRKWFALYLAEGYSHARAEELAFAKGDNGIGFFGDDTTGTTPMCALPPETLIDRWGSVEAAKHRPVEVLANDRSTICIVADKMPHIAHITNGARIDLNPAACAELGLTPPVMHAVIWRWVT